MRYSSEWHRAVMMQCSNWIMWPFAQVRSVGAQPSCTWEQLQLDTLLFSTVVCNSGFLLTCHLSLWWEIGSQEDSCPKWQEKWGRLHFFWTRPNLIPEHTQCLTLFLTYPYYSPNLPVFFPIDLWPQWFVPMAWVPGQNNGQKCCWNVAQVYIKTPADHYLA